MSVVEMCAHCGVVLQAGEWCGCELAEHLEMVSGPTPDTIQVGAVIDMGWNDLKEWRELEGQALLFRMLAGVPMIRHASGTPAAKA